MPLHAAGASPTLSPLHFSVERPGWPRALGFGSARGAAAEMFRIPVVGRLGIFGRRFFRGRAAAALPSSVAEEVRRVEARPMVEIPVTCYQIIGVSEKAEKDEIVKAIKELKAAEIEDGYSEELPSSRQDLLTDVRDKLLFEREYAGDLKERIPPRSSLQIPAAWVPAALSLLEEVEQERMVLDIGRQVMKRLDAKPYVHDIVLAMALAECGIAKASFEKRKISFGFEALARAQQLLRSKASLVKIPLLTQIEDSLQELVPECTLEILSMPRSADSSERRRGAIAALRELLRQGLDAESSCKVNDWPLFLSKAMSKLTAGEIVELLTWDTLATNRKNKKSLESQSQRIVVDSNCFYMAMAAHLATGFSTRQCEMINKAKYICECLSSSDSMDLKFEESFCLFLLGQETGSVAFEKLQQLQINGSSTSRNYGLVKTKGGNEKNMNHSLELWLKDAMLSLFADTRDCSPSLVNFFGAPKRVLNNFKPNIRLSKAIPSSSGKSLGEQIQHTHSTKQLGDAVKQLSSANNEVETSWDQSRSSCSPSVHVKRDNDSTDTGGPMGLTANTAGKIARNALIGLSLFGFFKMLNFQYGKANLLRNWPIQHMRTDRDSTATVTYASHSAATPPFKMHGVSNQLKNISKRLGKSSIPSLLMGNCGQDHSAPSNLASSNPEIVLHQQKMSVQEAESIIKQWQDRKAEALGPDHQIGSLEEILDNAMLMKWQEIAKSAREQSCYWRFVLLNISVSQANILYDGVGGETAEIEAVLEEAAELVDESQPKKPSYYSTYKVHYRLKKQQNKSWRICEGAIHELS